MASLRIAETFTSIQGEGQWVGVPSHFIRVSGCNLRCTWCDTPYASWKPEGPTETVEAILTRALASGVDHVVLTGGEPMLFEAIEELARGLKQNGKTITIETAGTIYRSLDCDLMSISPKLSNSTPAEEDGIWKARHENTRRNLSVLTQLTLSYPSQLKFVVTGPQDISEIEALLAELPHVKPSQVMLMAEGIEADKIRNGVLALIPICQTNNWRLTPRWHVDLFGNTRGT